MKQKHKRKKYLRIILSVCILLLISLTAGIFAIWHNELATLSSFKMLRDRDDSHKDGAVYSMHVSGDFYLDEFIAQGGVKNDSELIAFVTEQITHGLIPISISDPEIGCSSFTANDTSGDFLFARNYDFSKTNTCIVFTEGTEERHATISTVDLQFLGMDVDENVTGILNKITCLAAPYAPLDGINDAGVSCGIYMTYQGGTETISTDQDTELPDITSTTLLRLILDYADNVEEAVAIAQSYDLHDSAKTSYHYMVADSTGKSAILEWTYGTDASDNDGSLRTLNVIYSNTDNEIGENESNYNYQVITNFVLQPGYYDDSPEEDKKGFDRYEKIWEALQDSDCIVENETDAMNILALVGRRTWNNDDSNGCTVHSVVYNLTDKTMLWVPNENYDDPDASFVFGFDDN